MIHEGNCDTKKSLSNSVCKFVVSFGTILTCDCLQNIQCSLLYSCKTKKDISYSWKIRILQEMLEMILDYSKNIGEKIKS